MADEFKLVLYDRNGLTKRQAITDFLSLNYRIPVNEPGRLNFSLPANSPVLDVIETYDLVEPWRRNTALGIPWHRDFGAIYREGEFSTNEDGLNENLLKCPGQMSMLGYRVVAYPAGVPNRSAFASVPAETMMKQLVNYNCGSLATIANGRIREGNLTTGMGWTITTAPNLAQGLAISKDVANANILQLLTEQLAPVAGGDFSLTRIGTTEWEFQFHPGQLGEDKSTGPNKVQFSLEYGNLANPKLVERRLKEATVAVVGGPGKGTTRFYATVNGIDYAADNDLEIFTDASGETAAQGNSTLVTAGQRAMVERQADAEFTFDVLQTPAVLYSRYPVPGRLTYREGDLVSVFYRGTTYVRKVTAVEVNVTTPGQQRVDIKIETANIRNSS